jgi:hypothetical protein
LTNRIKREEEKKILSLTNMRTNCVLYIAAPEQFALLHRQCVYGTR